MSGPNLTDQQSTSTGRSAAAGETTGPGQKMVGPLGIIAAAAYLIMLTLVLFYSLIQIWPYPTPATTPKPNQTGSQSGGQAVQPPDTSSVPNASPSPSTAQIQSRGLPEPSPVTLFGSTFRLWDEVRLLLIVILTGALGSLVHSLRSLYWYVGNRALVLSWMLMYIMLPFVGASLALVFYFVIRGGFFSPQSSFEQTSPFGFAAFAALIGMFSQQAVLKLRDVADTLLVKPPPGEDTKSQDPGAAVKGKTQDAELAPVIADVAPKVIKAGTTDVTLVITGSNFKDTSVVLVNGLRQQSEFRSSTSLAVRLSAPADPSKGPLTVTVFTPGGGTSNAFNITISGTP